MAYLKLQRRMRMSVAGRHHAFARFRALKPSIKKLTFKNRTLDDILQPRIDAIKRL